MIIISDRLLGTDHLPLVELLYAIIKHSSICINDDFELTKLGGNGQRVWLLESQINAGETVRISIATLHNILSSEEEDFDELQCDNRDTHFGLNDATFLFVQATDKRIEADIATEFQKVVVHADRNWQRACNRE